MLFGKGKKERHAEKLIHQHIEKVGDVVAQMHQTVLDYCTDVGKVKKKAVEVGKLETEADEVRREIEMALYNGAFMPVERGDYVNLVERIDKIANGCEAVAQFLWLTRPDLDADTAEGLAQIMEVTARCYKYIPEMFKSFEDGQAVMELAHKVEEDESEVDDLFARTVRQLFKSDMDLARKIHIKMLLDRSAAVSNRIEDASDRFCIIVAKRP